MNSSRHTRKRRRTRKRGQKKNVVIAITPDDFFAQSEEFQTDWEDTLRVIAKMRSDGLSLKKAAKQEGVNPRTVSRLGRRALKRRSNGSYAVSKTDSLLRVLQVPTSEGRRELALRSSRDASTVGQYWDAVNKYIRTGDDSRLKKFEGKQIRDISGNRIALITDRKELNRLGSAGVLSFENLYSKTT
jgi:hypothetical protein